MRSCLLGLREPRMPHATHTTHARMRRQVEAALEASRGAALPAEDADALLMQSALLDGVILQLSTLKQAFAHVSHSAGRLGGGPPLSGACCPGHARHCQGVSVSIHPLLA
jgi:hypothetical protein